jgi:1,6-anhydro-N-acetylmuramate kinase
VSHFATEEAQWTRVDLARADWTTVRWVHRLVREHRDFEARLAKVLSRVEAAKKDGKLPSAAIETQIRAILADLLDHELSETRLFQRSIFETSIDPG